MGRLAPPRPGRLPWRRHDPAWALFFLGPQLIGLIVFSLGPLLVAFGLSFYKWDGLGPISFVGLRNFGSQLADPLFIKAVLNTAVYTLVTVPLGLGLALVLALAFQRVRGRTLYRVVYFLPVVTSSIAVSVVWSYLLGGENGPVNAILRDVFGIAAPNWLQDPSTALFAVSLVTIWWSVGLNIIIFLAALESIPTPVLDAAALDGATGLRRFRWIVVPLVSPAILFSTIVAVISSFQTFDQIYAMTKGGPLDATRTVVFHIYDLAFRRFEFGPASAAAMLLFAGTLIATLAQLLSQRRWVHYES
jgi:multiple sugar transport system permease protein